MIAYSLSGVAHYWGNPSVELCFASLKREPIHVEWYHTRAGATANFLEHVEGFYNRNRRHSSLWHVSPSEFESTCYR